jgi:hypothetical protein
MVAHRVRQWTQVVEAFAMHHAAVCGMVRWTSSCRVPHIIKIAVPILQTKKTKSYKMWEEKIHIWYKQLSKLLIYEERISKM